MLNIEKHRQTMFLILNDIFKSDFSSFLAFKGGTLAYFIYGLDRFSTDLDFDLLENIDIEKSLTKIIQKYGEVKKKTKIILSYENGIDNIKIDINRKIWKNNKYEFINFFGNTIKVQSKETVFTNKLVALTERNTNRDIYDIYFFFKNNFSINDDLILERTGKTRKKLFENILSKLSNLGNNYKILDGLGEVLNQKQKTFVKNNLIGDLIGMLQMNIQFIN